VDEYGRGEYFDSFGRPPSYNFRRYMDKHCGYIDGHITRDSFRVLLVVFAAIIVVSIASLEVEV
jgi:hypothetical protein